MGCNVYHIIAITVTGVSFVMLLATLGTSSMIKGCIGFNSALSSIGNSLKTLENTGPENTGPDIDMGAMSNTFLGQSNPFLGQKMCFSQGLMRESVSVGSISTVSFAVDARLMPAHVYIASGALCIGVILCLSAMIVLIVSTCGEGGSYEAKTRSGTRTRTAMILLGVTVALCLVGMTAYSIGSIKAKKNPMMFLAGFGSQAMESFGEMGPGSEIPPFGRGKRDLASDLFGNLINGLTISYGYSFILGWVSTVMAVISLLLTGFARYNLIQQPYSGSSSGTMMF